MNKNKLKSTGESSDEDFAKMFQLLADMPKQDRHDICVMMEFIRDIQDTEDDSPLSVKAPPSVWCGVYLLATVGAAYYNRIVGIVDHEKKEFGKEKNNDDGDE